MEAGLTEEERRCLFWLTRISGIGPGTAEKIWAGMKEKPSLYNIEEKELLEKKIVPAALAREVRNAQDFKVRRQTEKEYEELQRRNIRFLTPYDPDYPPMLSHIPNRPVGLFVKGRLPDRSRPAVAIVGARECTGYGREIARYFGRELSACGVQIISGMAAGIDSAGNWGAIEAGEATYGVLGCGINICYPKENYKLYEKIEETGGIFSEYSLGEPPKPGNFPRRNRIISGMSDVIAVIEAREKSGSLITAEIGLEQGKDIFAVPGRITDLLSAGCNKLIQSGAYPLLKPDDILAFFGIKGKKVLRIQEKSKKGLAKDEKKVYSCLDLQPKFIEEIVKECGLPVHECIRILLELELKGYIVQEANHYYRKNCG